MNNSSIEELFRYRSNVEREVADHVRARLVNGPVPIIDVHGLAESARQENLQQITQLVRDIHSDLFRGYNTSRQREIWLSNQSTGEISSMASIIAPSGAPDQNHPGSAPSQSVPRISGATTEVGSETEIEVEGLVQLGGDIMMEPTPLDESGRMLFDMDMVDLLSGTSFAGMADFDLSCFLSGPAETGLPQVIEQPLVVDG